MPAERLQLKYFGPLLVWMAVIFYASSIPGDRIPEIKLWSADKITHMLVYSVLSWSAWRAAKHYALVHGRTARWALSVSIVGCILFGASDEVHQYFVPNRSSEWADVVADAVGVLVTHGVLWRWYNSNRK